MNGNGLVVRALALVIAWSLCVMLESIECHKMRQVSLSPYIHTYPIVHRTSSLNHSEALLLSRARPRVLIWIMLAYLNIMKDQSR